MKHPALGKFFEEIGGGACAQIRCVPGRAGYILAEIDIPSIGGIDIVIALINRVIIAEFLLVQIIGDAPRACGVAQFVIHKIGEKRQATVLRQWKAERYTEAAFFERQAALKIIFGLRVEQAETG